MNWAFPLSLAATKGISVDFFSSGYLDVSVLRVRFYTLLIQMQILSKQWVSPFGNLRIKVCLPTPRSLSQATTSFIASYRLGIRRMRLFAWPYNLKQFGELPPSYLTLLQIKFRDHMFADAIQMHIPKYILSNVFVSQTTIERSIVCDNQFSKFLKNIHIK